MQVFGDLILIDATEDVGRSLVERLEALNQSERTRVIKPGTYEVERIPNPYDPAHDGLPWIVLKGTKQGLTCREVLERGSYVEGCPLKLQLIEELKQETDVKNIYERPHYVHELLARVCVANAFF